MKIRIQKWVSLSSRHCLFSWGVRDLDPSLEFGSKKAYLKCTSEIGLIISWFYGPNLAKGRVDELIPFVAIGATAADTFANCGIRFIVRGQEVTSDRPGQMSELPGVGKRISGVSARLPDELTPKALAPSTRLVFPYSASGIAEDTVTPLACLTVSPATLAERFPSEFPRVKLPQSGGGALETYAYRGHLYLVEPNIESPEDVGLHVRDKYERDVKSLARIRANLAEAPKLSSRERIPENVRTEVWRRDEGKCQRCGSNERLEYDHIIPVSKGGSNTVRNIQLLCEHCNRSKHGNLM